MFGGDLVTIAPSYGDRDDPAWKGRFASEKEFSILFLAPPRAARNTVLLRSVLEKGRSETGGLQRPPLGVAGESCTKLVHQFSEDVLENL